MILRTLFVASAVLLVALPAHARRPDEVVTLEYLPSGTAVALCPAADYIGEEVYLRLGYTLFQATASNHLTITVDKVGGQFRAVGELRNDDGEITLSYTFQESNCTEAVRDIVIMVAIRFTKLPEPLPCSPAPSPPAPSPPTPPALRRPALLPPAAPPPLQRHRFQAGIGSNFSIGLAPTVVGGAEMFLGVRWPEVSLSVDGRALLASSVTIERATVRHNYRSTVVAVGATGCYHPTWAFLCVRVETGSLSFVNLGVELDPIHYSTHALGFRFGGDRILTPWLALRAYVQAQAQTGPNTLRDRPRAPILWAQPQLSGSIGLGPVFTFSGL
ncbi:MAG: hypothetical protein ACMG6S_05760 [Byssovorax sp.]